MKPWLVMLLSLVALYEPTVADAQQCDHRYSFRRHWSPWVIAPAMGYSGFTGPGYTRTISYQVGYYPAPRINPFTPDLTIPQPMTEPSFLVPNEQRETPFEPTKVPVVPSSPAARLRSLQHQARGDQRLREQRWSEARAAYRAAVDAAPDRAEAHLRLGLSLITIQSFQPAIRELKRAVFIDPTIPASGNQSKILFGPESDVVRSSIISKVMDWVREDYRESDRLFVLGVLLHFEGDARSREFLEAADRMKRQGDKSHILAFLDHAANAPAAPQDEPVDPAIPKLNDVPLPMPFPAQGAEGFAGDHGEQNGTKRGQLAPLPGAPVPMPDL
ncbi:tetratricopeptide repeat protein [Schlesneria sp. DSM 10557]|uniref:tetratricopeptide repeat protein n=2 Tax=unclassified Schlesneria TaxID=2762017 RepID=UPI00359FD6FC